MITQDDPTFKDITSRKSKTSGQPAQKRISRTSNVSHALLLRFPPIGIDPKPGGALLIEDVCAHRSGTNDHAARPVFPDSHAKEDLRSAFDGRFGWGKRKGEDVEGFLCVGAELGDSFQKGTHRQKRGKTNLRISISCRIFCSAGSSEGTHLYFREKQHVSSSFQVVEGENTDGNGFVYC